MFPKDIDIFIYTAETHLDDRELLHIVYPGGGFLQLRGRTWILVISKRDRQSFDDDGDDSDDDDYDYDSNNDDDNLSNILRKYKIKDLQTAAMLDPAQALGEDKSKKHSTWEITLRIP